ncbi:MAG: dihydroorotate dehydrogenase [Spirochaetaceae bacterium]|nr:dihydroorotate dehydrogenase [Spirochaetaceae bacterium]
MPTRETVRGNTSLTVDLGTLRLANPVLVASGTFGYASELEGLVDLARLGGIVTKTVTVKPRPGNPPPRIVETPAGMLNAIGLQNVGIDRFVTEKLPYLAGLDPVVLVSVMGYTTGEFVTLAERLDGLPGVDGLELNLSCPNVAYGAGDGAKMFAHEPELTAEAVGAVRSVTSLPVIAKLGPDVADIAAIGRAAEAAGADALAVMNTIPGMVIDLERRRPVLANVTGGLSGPAIRPLAVRLTYQLAGAVDIPVVGVGGIMDHRDALQFLMAGASAVQVGTATFTNPSAALEVLDGLEGYLRDSGVERIADLIGAAQPPAAKEESE